jgi:DNA-directed RNA polymerase specialized sigma subunit
MSESNQAVVESCLKRARRWRPPPRWSSREWWEENRAEAALIALDAARDYDAGRGVSWESFLQSRLMAGLLTRLRREWKSTRFLTDARSPDFLDVRTRIERDFTDDEVGVLYAGIVRLSPVDRQVLQGLYWDGMTESDLALTLGRSQQAISKRRKTIIIRLKRMFS